MSKSKKITEIRRAILFFNLFLFIVPLSDSANIVNLERVVKPLFEPEPVIICFDNYSFILNEFGIKQLIDNQNKHDSLVMKNQYFQQYDKIRLYPFCLPAEYKNNKYIGVQRSLEIIDFLERKFHIQRQNISIVDSYQPSVSNTTYCSGVVISRIRLD